MTAQPDRDFHALESIANRGGLAAAHELAADGISRGQLVAMRRHGRIVRVRQGWYARPGLHHDVMRAARVGGLLTCRSALALSGYWVVGDERLHVAVESNDCQLRAPHDARQRLRPVHPVTVHWGHRRGTSGSSRLIVEPAVALADLAACTTPELLTAAADSVLHRRPEMLTDIRRLAESLWSAAQVALGEADGICESGTETLFWLRMRRLAPRRQVPIRGVGRVDFLFGDRLVVEVDGDAFHSGSSEFESDRRRDALLSALGYRVLRFSYHQVMYRWPEVHAAVLAAILRGDLT
jgi:very-short-patch-repair endonuclease